MLFDEAPGQIAIKSEALAVQLNIVPIWLPKQCSELNAMDQLWCDLKSQISGDYQFANIDEHAAFAECWVKSLTPTEALCKVSVLSKNFWLKSFFK